jgi:hypothetical protein
MSSGPDKPKEVKASEGEKIQAQVAKDQIDYYRSTYAPLEGQYAKEAGRDYSDRLSGQAGTAGARGMTDTLQVAAAAASPLDTAALSSGTSLGRVAGMAEGQRLSADGKLNALKVGLGATADATRSLTEASRMQNDSLMQAEQLKLEEAKTKAAGRAMTMAAVGQAAGMYAGYKLPQVRQKQLTQQKALSEATRQQSMINAGTNYRGAHGF